jgi:Uma2 family endonuclease
MAMPSRLPHTWTADEVLAIPESPGYRFEAVDGALIVSPSPSLRHQVAVGALSTELLGYARRHRIGLVLGGPLDIVPDTHTVVQPDVLVLPLVANRPPKSWQEAGRLLLAVEVLSPSSERTDRRLKRRKYQEMGTVSWLVDLEERLVEVWRPGVEVPETHAQLLAWEPPSTLPPLEIDLISFFAHVDGEEF